MQTEAIVILPQPASDLQIGVETTARRPHWPCLWLLHGLSDDHTIWTRRTSIERYADAAGCAVVMPNCHRSFYCDMRHGAAYWTYLTEELPALMRSFFPLSVAKADNAVAGLSMGGYGAAKWLLSRPDDFVAGASLSGAMDVAGRNRQIRGEEPDRMLAETLRLVFGEEEVIGSDADLFTLLEKSKAKNNLPPLLQICGTEDFLYEDNQSFTAAAEAVGYPLTTREQPGSHEWGFWDETIQEVLQWLPEQGFAVM